MRKTLSALVLICSLVRGADWPTAGGSPQRDGWAKSETAFTRDNVKGLDLLYKYKADTSALTTPIIDGRIITYLGFKEMLVFGGAADTVYSVDADLNRLIWKTHLDSHGGAAANTCGGMTAPVAMPGSSTAVVSRGGPRPPIAPRAAAPVRRPNRGGEFYAISSDGYLHVLNTSTGEDRSPTTKFLPPNAKVSALNVNDNVLYAATLEGCGGKPDALFAADLSTDERKVVSQPGQGGSIAGTAGTAIGSDGFVYAQVQNLHGDHNDGIFALDPKTLGVKGYFLQKNNVMSRVPGITPLVFSRKGTDVLAAAGADGRLYLFDPKALHTPLFQSETTSPGGFQGTFASWEDPADGQRWIYASAADSVTGFKVEDRAEKPVLTQVWTSSSMKSPAAPVIANGLVFTLSASALTALDSQTGKILYTSGDLIASPLTGSLAIANRRIYFTAQDNTVYCFGFFADQPQLTDK